MSNRGPRDSGVTETGGGRYGFCVHRPHAVTEINRLGGEVLRFYGLQGSE